MRQIAVDFQPHGIVNHIALYLFYTPLWYHSMCLFTFILLVGEIDPLEKIMFSQFLNREIEEGEGEKAATASTSLSLSQRNFDIKLQKKSFSVSNF